MEKDKYSMIYTEENLRKIMLCGLNILKKTNYIYFSDPFQVLDNKMKRVMIMFPIKIESLKKDDYYGFELSHNPRFLLWNGIITHNTVVSLAISSMIGLRTLILVNKIMLIDQWIETIKKVFGDYTRIQCIKSQSKIEQGCQFYIMNAINVPKRNSEFYQDLKIGFVIVDECHLILTKIFSRALSYICPRYLLGLSATPFRPDGFDSLFELYFGLKKVVKKLYKAHTVYLVETNIKIVAEKDKRGETIWNSVIDEQTTNDERNKLIIKICLENKNRNILVLSKRICQIEWLYENLKDLDHIAILKDGETQFNRDARILIATFQKVGTGFSHDKLDMLVLATDAEEYFIQYLGRVFRRPDVEPIIFDIVDDNPILKRHFLTRKKVYQEAGGKIVIYK
jgi:superfamily II DNA or RNA helicase